MEAIWRRSVDVIIVGGFGGSGVVAIESQSQFPSTGTPLAARVLFRERRFRNGLLEDQEGIKLPMGQEKPEVSWLFGVGRAASTRRRG